MMQTVEGEVLSESNLLQTLQQHGLALSADDLHTLRNFIKPSEVNDNQNQFINQQVDYFFIFFCRINFLCYVFFQIWLSF